MSTDSFARNTLAPLTLRLALAAVFIYHGVEKITGPQADWGVDWARRYWERQAKIPADVASKLEKLAGRDDVSKEQKERILDIEAGLNTLYASEGATIPVALLRYHTAQLAVAWGEVVCGALLLLGLGSRLAAAALFLIQLGAVYTVTWDRGFSFEQGGGYEYNFVLLATCLAVVFMGGGPFSLTRLLMAKRRRARQAPQAVSPEPARV
jgi:uncharacterized membrane protein YphA (DoxX/SURF4 family)